jgi:hypothetical protein
MKLEYLSYSGLSTWVEKCQRLLWEKNENDFRPFFENEFTNYGKAFHCALDTFYKNTLINKPFTEDDFNAIFIKYNILDLEKNKESYETFKHFVKKRDYENKNIIGTEEKFDIYLPNGVRLLGFFDLIYEDGDSLYIVDFKTDHMRRDYFLQRIVYTVAARILYQNYKNYYFVIDFINFDSYQYDHTHDFQEFYQFISNTWDVIINSDLDSLEHRPGPHCMSCPEEVLKTCPYFKQALSYKDKGVNDISPKLINEKNKIEKLIDVLEARKSMINSKLMEYYEKEVNESGKDIVSIGNTLLSLSQREISAFPYEKAKQLFGDKINASLDVSLTKLKKILDKDELKKFEENKITTFSKPFLKLKDNK